MLSIIRSIFGKENVEVVPERSSYVHEIENYGEQTKSLWKQLKDFIGKDITSLISLPIWVFEPVTLLQILCQPLYYSELLDQASAEDDPCKRLVYLSAFIVAGYSLAIRTKKPFNPYLGETFEYISKERNFKFVAEQVSHHPPISASTVIGEGYILELELGLETRLKGNYADIIIKGSDRIQFTKYGELITWPHLNTTAHNIIVGGSWVDHHGTLDIINRTTNEKSILNLYKGGWFDSGKFKLEGNVYDKDGNLKYILSGHWDDAIYYASALNLQEKALVWRNKVSSKDVLGPINLEMNIITEEIKNVIPPTDSRFRSDRLLLEKGNNDAAAKEKLRLEQEQRIQKKRREQEGITWTPRYFKLEDDPYYEKKWKYLNNYWELREQGFPNLKNDPNLPNFITPETALLICESKPKKKKTRSKKSNSLTFNSI